MNKKTAYVLVVEDDPWLAEHHKRQLVQAGFAAAVVCDALAAIDSIDERKPNAIVLDVWLAGPNGIALLHELKSHTDLADIPIILCTSSMDEMDVIDVKEYGVRRLIDKSRMALDSVVVAVREVT